MKEYIEIKGAHIHNLKNIDVRIPKNKMTVITGVSGSGKSSLAFNTLFEEGRRRYLLFSGSAFFIDAEPHFESMTGLSPTVAVEQRVIRQSNPRSTVGTRTKISNMLALLYSVSGRGGEGAPLDMAMFQRNSPKGMCVKCLGSGKIRLLDEDALFSDRTKRICDLVYGLAQRGSTRRMMDDFCARHHVELTQTVGSLPENLQTELLCGGGKTRFPGFLPWINTILQSPGGRLRYLLTQDGLLGMSECPRCHGSELGSAAMGVRLGGKNIYELESLYIGELLGFLQSLALAGEGAKLAGDVMQKLRCLSDVGLSHLSLSRPVPTLSGGELQRLFLASFIIAEMDSIIFVFDEPTIGLHEIEKGRLIEIMRRLVAGGNTVVAVEHDENFMRAADYIIDLGPGAGVQGGERIYQGPVHEFMHCERSRTAPYLCGAQSIGVKTEYRPVDPGRILRVENACVHNLKNVAADIPLGVMVGIAGVSGSGKSSLVADTLVPKLRELLKNRLVYEDSGEGEAPQTGAVVTGWEQIARCVVVDQRPIGRSKVSCPATYTGIFDRVRALFATTQQAQQMGCGAGLFTVNSEGGCRVCHGEGVVRRYIGYNNTIDLACEACGGTGFVEEALSVRLDGKNIRDVLSMSVSEAAVFFGRKESPAYDRAVLGKLRTLERIGMGYIRLGQQTPTISGGEAQRIKLAKELSNRRGQGGLYILDEPTTGLSFDDTKHLLTLLDGLVEAGNTVIVTEHDPAVLSNCDYIIELGPGGGNAGGSVIAAGSPRELLENRNSVIAGYLRVSV